MPDAEHCEAIWHPVPFSEERHWMPDVPSEKARWERLA